MISNEKLCRSVVGDKYIFYHELTEEDNKDKLPLNVNDQSITISSSKGAPSRAPLLNVLYIPSTWESVRPGADDHKQHRSLCR